VGTDRIQEKYNEKSTEGFLFAVIAKEQRSKSSLLEPLKREGEEANRKKRKKKIWG